MKSRGSGRRKPPAPPQRLPAARAGADIQKKLIWQKDARRAVFTGSYSMDTGTLDGFDKVRLAGERDETFQKKSSIGG